MPDNGQPSDIRRKKGWLSAIKFFVRVLNVFRVQRFWVPGSKVTV
jgi:hypothetical protein